MFEVPVALFYPGQGQQPPEDVNLVAHAIQNCLYLRHDDVGLVPYPKMALFPPEEAGILETLAPGHAVCLSEALDQRPVALSPQIVSMRRKLALIPPSLFDSGVPNIYSVGKSGTYMATAKPLLPGAQFIPPMLEAQDEDRLRQAGQTSIAGILTQAVCTHGRVTGTAIIPDIFPYYKKTLLALLAEAGQPLTSGELADRTGYSAGGIPGQIYSLRETIAQFIYEGRQLAIPSRHPSGHPGYYLSVV